MVIKALAILGFFVFLIILMYLWLFHWVVHNVLDEGDE